MNKIFLVTTRSINTKWPMHGSIQVKYLHCKLFIIGLLLIASLKPLAQKATWIWYPGDYEKGKVIEFGETANSIVFHAGTKINDNQLKTDGGRVVAVSSFGKTMNEALDKSYESIKNITFEGMCYRKDIGKDLLKS